MEISGCHNPPTFFDIIVHLVLHLPNEALYGGSIYMRWIYPFQRYMKTKKNYVRNKVRSEGSIAEEIETSRNRE